MKVFISYSRLEASETAKTIHSYLTEYGHHEVFIDTSDIRGGDEWWKTIQENISNCDIFIILVTRSALLRQYVKKEIELAKKLEKRIIPCIAKFVKYKDLQSDLTKYHGIRYENFDQLIQELGYLIDLEGKTPKPDNSSLLFSSEQLDKETESSQSFLEKAKGLEEIGQYSRALKTYDEVLKINPNYFEASYNKGLLHEKMGDFENARKALDKATYVDWKHKDVWYHFGKVLEKLERYDEALDALNTDLRIDDKDVKSWTSKAKLLEKLGKYEEALEAFDEILNRESNNIEILNKKGNILHILKKYDESLQYYDKVLSIDSKNVDVLAGKAIVLSDLKRYNEAIKKYKFIAKWGSYGWGDGEFTYPHGISTDSSGNVYVVDSVNQRIQKFDNNGKFITELGSRSGRLVKRGGTFKSPEGISVDSKDNVYITDIDDHHIQKFDSNGTFIAKWGSKGAGDGQFVYPQGISVDTKGYVYVADSGNYRIQKFDSNGTFITKWGSKGAGDGQFNSPKGISLDTKGYVYVVDSGNSRIEVFAPAPE